jgi:glycosyltransferase involved in cell wall biosynthesis
MSQPSIQGVILSAGNIARYHHTAFALQQAGLLEKYFCTLKGFDGHEKWLSFLPTKWLQRVKGKNLDGLQKQYVHQLPLPYLFSQSLRQAGLISEGRTNLLFANTYDQLVKHHLTESRVFHWVHSTGLRSAQKAKNAESLLICDVRAEYIDTYESRLRQEHEYLGVPYYSTRSFLRDRLIDETLLADYLIVNSDHVAKSFINNGYDQERIFVLSNGVNLRHFSKGMKKKNQSDSKFSILFVGNLTPLKGVHYLLQAFDKLNIPNSELLLVGNPDPDYKELLRKMRIDRKSVKFLGHIPQIELFKYYRQSDVFVLPSLSEGSANVIYEAMSAELPIVTTPNAGSVVRDGVDGFIVPIRNTEVMMEKLVYLYEHRGDRIAMGQEAARRVQEFSWERYRERLVAIYGQIAAQKGF